MKKLPFKKRRLLLLIPVILFTLDATVDEIRIDLYQGIATAVTGIIAVYNVPFIISAAHSKPKYIEDIILEYELTDEKRDKYKRVFEYVIGTLSSLLLGGLVYNTLRTNNEITSWMNLAGIAGGILSMYGKFLKFAGKIFLSCLDKLKQRKERNSTTNRTEIAMQDITRITFTPTSTETKASPATLPPDHFIKSQLSKHSISTRERSNT